MKYRARNSVGWSPYSDESFVLAATTPTKPDRPYFLSFANDVLSIVVPRSTGNGGSPISGYELWADEGDNFTSDFRLIASLSAFELTYSATELNDSLVKGKTYRFISRALNEIGYSEYSIYSYIAFGDVSEAPGAPLITNSTETSISLSW